ncbi:carnitine o-palmitoyltransferase 1, liver isoform [Plakobranchus ocellatus]|uniref:Carnitine o-palmitoyltransferase 1, liver isoform n=1 Tax=Plakobranchus ocellatus TaxID=259542 RepID=A0AAV4BAF0_9GAST|nr:carnitine o-palmitoyltransferase 1, liver isoform [Plakobranchus ocellatus]
MTSLTESTPQDELSTKAILQHRVWRLYKGYKSTINKLNGVLWPGSLLNLGLTIGALAAVRISHVGALRPIKSHLTNLESFTPFSHEVPKAFVACSLAGLILFLTLTFCRKLMLRQLLKYRVWMYENPARPCATTKLWGVLVKVLSGWRPSLYSYQGSLPRMPVPPLRETMRQLVESFEPIYAEKPEKLEQLKKEAENFEATLGPKLQKALILRSWWADNFVSDWWEKYVYLMGRTPLPINSNYYIMDQCYWTPTDRQCARAAGVLYQMLLVRDQVLTEEFEPLSIRKMIPVCMAQYRRLFSTTRVPGEEIDTLVNYSSSESQHIVVNRRGLLYKVDVTDKFGNLVSPCDLEKQMEWIVEDADNKYEDVPESERLVPVLTSTDRTTWARTRAQYFSSGLNKESLQCIESAVMMVVLDTHSFSDLSGRASHLLHGDVGQYWFDKSIELISMSDGHVGLNCEHSYADAPVVAHVIEFNLTYDAISNLYDESGHCLDLRPNPLPTKLRSKPTPLHWEMSDKLAECISRACSQAEKDNNDLDLVLYDHTEFGKGDIKKCKLSPDAFIQMALHTTYRKLTGTPVLTYEASMTRLFRNGRTETVRSLSREANNFVTTFLNPARPREESRDLLKAACERHAIMYKDAMNGKGIDRHLFALYVASRGMGVDCEFLKNVLSIPWTLSTSQQPQQQIWWSPGCGNPKYHDKLCPGGGFGPVANDGYGVSYMVPGDLRIFFHVSSRRSASGTNSQLFMDTLKLSMAEMRALYDLEQVNKTIGRHDHLLTTVWKRKQSYTDISPDAKTILQGTMQGIRIRGRQRMRKEDNMKEGQGDSQ